VTAGFSIVTVEFEAELFVIEHMKQGGKQNSRVVLILVILIIPTDKQIIIAIDVAAHAGTAFDGHHLFQLSGDRIQKIDPNTGRVLSTIPAPGGAGSGLTWAEGTLWIGQYRNRKVHQIDPDTGAVLRTIESNRFVTGVTWIDGELWHATLEEEESDLRRVNPQTGEVLERLEMPPGMSVSGLESDGGDRFFCPISSGFARMSSSAASQSSFCE
jgi:outer membrane protein assembly factor BamB